MIVHFDDLFTIQDDNVLKTKKKIYINGRTFAPETTVELEVVQHIGLAVSELPGKLFKTMITESGIEIHSILPDIVD